MPPRVHPNRTVALCGIRSDAESNDIEKILKDEGLLPACLESSGIAKLMKDKTDTDTDAGRRLVFLNCKSEDALEGAALPETFPFQPLEPPCHLIIGADFLSTVGKPNFPLISKLVEKVGSL